MTMDMTFVRMNVTYRIRTTRPRCLATAAPRYIAQQRFGIGMVSRRYRIGRHLDRTVRENINCEFIRHFLFPFRIHKTPKY